MTSLETALQDKDTTSQSDLHVSFELGDRSWKLSCSDGIRSPSRLFGECGGPGGGAGLHGQGTSPVRP